MKRLLALEEAAQMAIAFFLLYRLDLSVHWTIWFLIFFSPDLGAIGYLFNPKIGASPTIFYTTNLWLLA